MRIRFFIIRIKLTIAWAFGLTASDMHRVLLYKLNGIKMRVDISNRYEKSRWDRLASKAKEPETIEWIDSFNSNDIFVDIGANVGNYSLYAACRHQGLKVFSFEPEPNSVSQLIKNKALNKLANISIFMLPLSSNTSINYFYLKHDLIAGESNNQFGRRIDSGGERFTPTAQIGMCAVTLDSLIERGIVVQPNHIKIDVDGIENLVVSGMQKCLASIHLKSLLIELNGDELEVFKMIQYLENLQLIIKRRPVGLVGNYIFVRNEQGTLQ
jgi:FkbM family methyltransferase